MDATGRDARLAVVAGRQGGCLSRDQALALGFPSSTIGRRISSGAWEAVHPGVYVLGGAERTRVTDLWGAVLAAGEGAVVSHESAALIHGAEKLPVIPISLTAHHGAHHRLRHVTVHQIDDVAPAHLGRWNGLAVTTPARTVIDLGGTRDVATIGRVVDDFVRLGRTTTPEVGHLLGALLRPGKRGLDKVARVLDQRSDGYVPPHSELERRLFQVIEAGGLPAPVRQVPLPGRSKVRGTADAGYPDAKVILEADGRRWHQRVAAARQDRERDAQVVAAGWVPLRFVFEQIVHTPGEVCRVISETRAMRLSQLGRAA